MRKSPNAFITILQYILNNFKQLAGVAVDGDYKIYHHDLQTIHP
jgi:hypothetical protein